MVHIQKIGEIKSNGSRFLSIGNQQANKDIGWESCETWKSILSVQIRGNHQPYM